MVEKQVIWSPRANEEFRTILEFYLERNQSSEYSKKLVVAVDSLIKIVQQHNFIGRIANNKRTRMISFESFILFYELSDDRIEIMSMWDNRQNPEDRIDG